MLALNAMAHEPHGFSASMVATEREPTLPPDLEGDACASPALEDPTSYVEAVKKLLTLTHQQMTPPAAPVATNPYREGSLIFAMTTPPERTNKLAPRWKGPFVVKRVPNPYQVTYEDGLVWRTIHVNHAKPAKTPVTGFPAPLPTPEPPKPTLGYLPRSLQRPFSRRQPPPPQPAAPAEGSPAPAAAPPAATPPSSRRSARAAANRNSAPRAVQQPPPAPGRASETSWPGHQLRRSARLTPWACTVTKQPPSSSPPSLSRESMAQTFPLSLAFNQCLGGKEDPYAFSSVHLEDLRSGKLEHLVTVQQLVDAIPKTVDPASRFTLRGQVSPARHQRLHHSIKAALWRLVPSNGEFQRAPNGTHYYLARQGRHVVLRGGDVTQTLFGSCINWIYDPAPPALTSDNQASAIATSVPAGAPLTPSLPRKCRQRRQRRARRSANRNSAPHSATPATPDERWSN